MWPLLLLYTPISTLYITLSERQTTTRLREVHNGAYISTVSQNEIGSGPLYDELMNYSREGNHTDKPCSQVNNETNKLENEAENGSTADVTEQQPVPVRDEEDSVKHTYAVLEGQVPPVSVRNEEDSVKHTYAVLEGPVPPVSVRNEEDSVKHTYAVLEGPVPPVPERYLHAYKSCT